MQYLEILSSNNILRGMKHHCSRFADAQQPIIMVHGYFSATRNGPQRLFIELANQLASLGFTVYRFDLSGMGESEGDIKKITFQKHVEDLDAIVDFVQREHPNQPITIVAHSLGCNLALCKIQKDFTLYHKVVFLAPYLTNSNTIHLIIGDEKKLRELEKNNFTYRKGLYVDNSYFVESETEKFSKIISSLPIKFSIIVGDEDQFIPTDLTISALKNISNTEVTRIHGADHNFLETHKELVDIIVSILS